jgi:uncharacterized membrane protein YccC
MEVRSMLPRILNMLIGTWLMFSAFAWSHPPRQLANTIVCGLLTILFAVLSLYSRRGQQLGASLAVWLFVSGLFTMSTKEPTLWNNALCAIAIFVCSLSMNNPERRHHEQAYAGTSP